MPFPRPVWFRRKTVGFAFQSFPLIPSLSALENAIARQFSLDSGVPSKV